MNDAQLLGACPEYLCITQMLKATPAEESGRRFVYIEASNESVDIQGEIVLAKALEESADYYRKFGNLDIDHYTRIGAKLGIPKYNLYEIGRPVDVRIDGGRTFVKGEIFQGDGDAARHANDFWSSLTEITPPHRWYPSVGGGILSRDEDIDPETGKKRVLIKKVLWNNIGFSKTPVNNNVPTVSTVPIGVLAKSWTATGLDIAKALEAGYGTDSAQLTGGAALRRQSLHGAPLSNYFEFRERLASDIRAKKAGADPGIRDLTAFAAKHYGLSLDETSAWIARFMRDLKSGLVERRKR